jgi:hypothetical protein
MTPQPMPETTAIGPGDHLFFQCPMGGYASLHPGLCPKCNEPMVPVTGRNSAANEQRADVAARTEKVLSMIQ